MRKAQMAIPANRRTKGQARNFASAGTDGTHIVSGAKMNFFFADIAALPKRWRCVCWFIHT